MATSSAQPREESQRHRPGVIAPLAVLCLFAVALPVRISSDSAGVSKEECLTLAERARPGDAAALPLLEACSALSPADVELLSDLGAAYERTDPARAEVIYRRALHLDPGFADLRLRLGKLLLQRGAAADARAEAKAGLEIQPNRRALLDLRERSEVSGNQP